MKGLSEILRDVMVLLDERSREHVVIARGDHEPFDGRHASYQIRLRHDDRLYQCETRSWLGEQWSSWYERRGWLGGGSFDVSDVLATDWRIIS